MEMQDVQSDLVSPGRVSNESDAIARPAEQVAHCSQVAVSWRLVFQTSAVPNERLQRPAHATRLCAISINKYFL